MEATSVSEPIFHGHMGGTGTCVYTPISKRNSGTQEAVSTANSINHMSASTAAQQHASLVINNS